MCISECNFCRVSYLEKEEDPGLLLLWDIDRVHVALGQPGAPVPRGQTNTLSLRAMEDYVYDVIMSTPVEEFDHTIPDPEDPNKCLRNVYRRLPENTYVKIRQKLHQHFWHNQTPVATWSRNVSSPPNAQNSLPPHAVLAKVVEIRGGVGTGAVAMQVVSLLAGIIM